MSVNEYMIRAAELALRGKGCTRTNPCVGAVVARDGEVIAEGWHAAYGAPHAEVEAIANAGNRAKNADLYVTLEPCTTYGKTPPCVNAIANSGIKRVFIGTLDPNPKHTGNAVKFFTERGIEVNYGVEAKLCALLIEDFTKFTTTGLPYVTVKIAQSLDGKIAAASGENRWITGAETRKTVHKLRKESDAVLVGIGTVLADDPELTVRGVSSDRQPARIVLDGNCRIPLDSKLVIGTKDGIAEMIIFTTESASVEKVSILRDYGIKVIVAGSRITIQRILTEAAALNIMNILVEGGAKVFASFLMERQADMLHIFMAPILIGGGSSKNSIDDLGGLLLKDAYRVTQTRYSTIGEDLWLRGKVNDYTEKALSLTFRGGLG